jgi:Zn-dependent M28 family amino/carboxypeptidase
MRRFVFSFTAALLGAACLTAAQSPVTQAPAGQAPPNQAAATLKSALFDAQQLLKDLEILSADDMQGRRVATPGGEKARAYVVERFKASGILPFGASYESPFAIAGGGRTGGTETTGVNVVGRIEGRNTSRYIVITAHYDHIGVRNGEVFNGADDNASGTAALFALAKYFSTRKPANSLLFVAFDAEEGGLRGARAFVAKPPVPAESLIINLNMDMIGRDTKDLLYVAGTTPQPFLKPFIERIAAKAPVKLTMGYDSSAWKENWMGQSDHAAFCQAKIPCLYFGVEDFENHHKATDDYATMTHGFYVRAVETMVRAVEEFDANLDAVIKARGAEPRDR